MKPNLIETMLACSQGDIALWRLHVQRLTDSASQLRYPRPDPAQLRQTIEQALAQQPHAQAPQWRVRLLFSHEGDISVTVQPLAAMGKLQKVAISSTRLCSTQSWLAHKSTHRPWYEAATQWLGQYPAYFDVIFLNERDELCEGTRSNLYLFLEDQWVTPARSSGLLGGVWRRKLLDEGLVQERVLPLSCLTSEVPLRLSNGLRGWFDVSADFSIKVP